MKICTAPDCDRKLYCKGLCRRHYAFTLYIDERCDYCQGYFKTEPDRRKRYQYIYCGEACRSKAVRLRDHPERYALDRLRNMPAIAVAIVILIRLNVEAGSSWVAGVCRVCGDHWVADRIHWRSATCSDECRDLHFRDMKYDSRTRRRARLKGAFIAPVYRAEIYKRDNFCCQLCGDPVDMDAESPEPMSPSIDHIIPLAKGGTHEPANCQLAHFRCNSLKSDRMPLLLSA